MFVYETHCHTKRTSKCSALTAEDIVELYVKNGYRGVFITDHFLSGNTTVNAELGDDAPYREKIETFCKGYEEVRAAAGDALQVFFGFEHNYKGTDVLVYGWNKEQLLKLEGVLDLTMRGFCDFCRANGALAVQAHPFREAKYIDHIRLFPNAEGVETFNAARTDLCNDLAAYYAKAYGKPVTGGSDIHKRGQKMLSGMAFEEPLASEADFIERIRHGRGMIVRRPNVLCAEASK